VVDHVALQVVNDTLPPHQRTHDHDKALSNALHLGVEEGIRSNGPLGFPVIFTAEKITYQ
jgi:hypothetical protein